jgi:hypothetical protein
MAPGMQGWKLLPFGHILEEFWYWCVGVRHGEWGMGEGIDTQ